jgi:hypothetical protein
VSEASAENWDTTGANRPTDRSVQHAICLWSADATGDACGRRHVQAHTFPPVLPPEPRRLAPPRRTGRL